MNRLPSQSYTLEIASSISDIIYLIYINSVNRIRRTHGHPIVALSVAIGQNIVMVGVFALLFHVLGAGGNQIRGDFFLFLLSGVFIYFTHVKAMGAVMSAENSTSELMKHSTMNTVISISSAALSVLYIQVISLIIIALFYDNFFGVFFIDDLFVAVYVFLLAWALGIGVGLFLVSLRPWAPFAVSMINTLYSRLNMVASGKMFVAGSLAPDTLVFFSWNPLFHTIDLMRDAVFANYAATVTSGSLPVLALLGLILIGGIITRFTASRASASWNAHL